jgi:ADP-ribosylglycohydrolase
MSTLATRIRGALLGAAIGAELGFSRFVARDAFACAQPEDVFALTLAPVGDVPEERGRVMTRRVTPFINIGVQAYLRAGGRATPEGFAAVLRDDAGVAAPCFGWDGMHSIQEVLKEGMPPRISGMGAAPCGLIAAAMPAVGCYHAADPEYAYLDGVELASVAQPRLGADWAALGAAAVAAALAADPDPAAVVDTVLKLAHANNPDLFYVLNLPAREAGWQGDDAGVARWWLATVGRGEAGQAGAWVAPNPLRQVLPLLPRYAADPQKLFALILAPEPFGWYNNMAGANSVAAVLAGAIAGALHGPEVFPAAWHAWTTAAEPWYALADVVDARLDTEREVIAVTARLAEPRADGSTLLYDKIYGCMLAGAIGNAMGSPVEGLLYTEIDARYPDGITGILDPSRLESEDDNQMAMLLVETYLGREGLPVLARHFGKTWAERLNRDHFFTLCMGNGYDLIRAGWDPRIVGHWSQVTGSTVMCMEPVGLYHLADPAYAALDATAVSYMYQRGLDVTAAAMLAATTAEAMRPDASVDRVLQAALDVAPRTPFHTFDARPFQSAYDYIATCLEVAEGYDDVMAVRAALHDRCLLYHHIDPLELWGLALAMFKVADGDVRQAAIGGTNIGRDSDTIAGRAAMLAGTLRGAGNVPPEWTALFSEASRTRIQRNAARLADFIARTRTTRLQARQALAAV